MPATGVNQHALERRWVLVVDPDAAARERTAAGVHLATDAAICRAASAAEALAALDARMGEAGELVMIVARCALPDSSGLALWRAVSERAGRRAVVACVLVADERGGVHGECAAEEALAAGADVVREPLREAELCARVRRAMVARAARAASALRERRLTDRYRRLERRRTQLEQLVHVDALTGVINRRHLEEVLGLEIRRAQRDETGLAAVIVDVDYFHEYNEEHGHLAGDACLERVAGALAAELRRPSDVVGRWGGDEFLVLLPRTDAAGAARVAERLRRAVVREVIPHETPAATVVTVSLGVGALAPEQAAGEGVASAVGELLALADGRLLEAKRLGRDRWAGPAHGQAAPARASGTWPAPVRVDPTLYDRVPDALARKQLELDGLDGSEPLRALGLASDLKRLGRDLGFREVARLGGRLERAVRAGDSRAVSRIATEVLAYLDRVPVIYLREHDQR